MGNSKSTGLSKITHKTLDTRMGMVGMYLGYGRMLLEAGDKVKTKLPSENKNY